MYMNAKAMAAQNSTKTRGPSSLSHTPALRIAFILHELASFSTHADIRLPNAHAAESRERPHYFDLEVGRAGSSYINAATSRKGHDPPFWRDTPAVSPNVRYWHKADIDLTSAVLTKPCPDEALKIWPVDKRVGNVRNNGPQLVLPVLS